MKRGHLQLIVAGLAVALGSITFFLSRPQSSLEVRLSPSTRPVAITTVEQTALLKEKLKELSIAAKCAPDSQSVDVLRSLVRRDTILAAWLVRWQSSIAQRQTIADPPPTSDDISAGSLGVPGEDLVRLANLISFVDSPSIAMPFYDSAVRRAEQGLGAVSGNWSAHTLELYRGALSPVLNGKGWPVMKRLSLLVEKHAVAGSYDAFMSRLFAAESMLQMQAPDDALEYSLAASTSWDSGTYDRSVTVDKRAELELIRTTAFVTLRKYDEALASSLTIETYSRRGAVTDHIQNIGLECKVRALSGLGRMEEARRAFDEWVAKASPTFEYAQPLARLVRYGS